jgi:putative acyl-CoA dehydrogenase
MMRALRRTPDTLDAFIEECSTASGSDRRFDEWLVALERDLGDSDADEASARQLVERMGLALQGSLLVRHGDPAVADAFCASRLSRDGGLAYGTLPSNAGAEAIVERHRPRAR